jgi:hypothetical protein
MFASSRKSAIQSTEASMTNNSTIILWLKIVVLFFVLGGVGAAGGTKLMMFMNGGECLQGSEAGWVYLLASACLAVPGMLLLRH